jgi:hypothetical protein
MIINIIVFLGELVKADRHKPCFQRANATRPGLGRGQEPGAP